MLGNRGRAAVVLSLLALPALAAGCGSAATSTERERSAGPDWIVVAEGSATPSPAVKRGVASPSPSATIPAAAGTGSPTPAPSGSGCATGSFKSGQINGATVTPDTTSAVVTWMHPGGTTVIDYRVTAITQALKPGQQTEVGFTTAVPDGCGMMSAVVNGLEPGTPYVFSVDGVFPRQEMDGTYTRTVARSRVVSTM